MHPIGRLLALSAWCALVACGSGTTTTIGPDGGSAPADAGAESCKSARPASQAASQPCCTEWGPDACGAQLFCAALDGRTQATCYPDRSRLGGESCTADTQCLANACDVTQVCKGVPGGKCTPAVGCGTALESGTKYTCVTESGGAVCRPCTSTSSDPACGGPPTEDGGPSPPTGVCVKSCTANAQCQSSCPPVTSRVSCCDSATGTCYQTTTPTCPAG